MNRHSRVVAIVACTLLLGACNLINRQQAPDDKSIATDVQARLFQDPTLKTRDIHVDSQKGVVTLTGTVQSDLEKAAVERLASQANGVKQVIDQLNVVPPPPAPEAAQPAPAATTAAAPPAQPEPQRKKPRPTRRASGEASSRAATAPSPAAAPVQASAPAASAPPPPQPVQITIPSGTAVTVQMIDSVDTSRNHPGDEFAASLATPIVVGDKVVVPQGADARVRLVEASSSGKFRGSSQLSLELVSVTVHGTPYSVQSSYYTQQGSSRGKRTAEAVGGGAVLGGLIGAIAGGRKGAAIGAGVGAGTGAGVEGLSKTQVLRVPSETKIDFTLKAPLTVTLKQ
jgi:hypothetical protein